MRLTLSFFCLLATAVHAAPADMTGPQIGSLETGVICPPPTVGETAAPDTVAGVTHLVAEDPPFVSMSRRVPAVIGIGFGAKSTTADLMGLSEVTMTVTHPPMGKDRITQQSFLTRIDGISPSLTFYQFDYAYELVQGRWQMEAVKDGEVLYRASFDVVAPKDAPALAQVCGFEELLS
ncbi:DUF3859 domain-containing protein [Loktanella sp. DJP18]|uniref:DUF3859 domain-containing protein n=1 Tax=Loktanella sp. DJP18 TaxID=3409788 RepID=UPI003BB4FFB4